jgi:hypothetical protein
MPEKGVYENGVFYYGAVYRDRPAPVETPKPIVESFDYDAPDEINARRFFGFTDYEEVCVFLLRSRYSERKKTHSRMAQFYYDILRYFAK